MLSLRQKSIILFSFFLFLYSVIISSDNSDIDIPLLIYINIPIILYWSGIWLWGWKYEAVAFGYIKSKISKFYIPPYLLNSINLFSFKGRINRKKYFIYNVLAFLLIIIPFSYIKFANTNALNIEKQITENCLINSEKMNDPKETEKGEFVNFGGKSFWIEYINPKDLCLYHDKTRIYEKKLRNNTVLMTILYLIFIIPITVKRCHDIGYNGYVITSLIIFLNYSHINYSTLNKLFYPYTNDIVFILSIIVSIGSIVLFIKKGEPCKNRYGKNPLDNI